MKRGQVAVFVIVGLVLLFLVALILLLSNSSEEPIDIIDRTQPTTPLEKFIDTCLDQTVQQGLFLLGTQGGYLELPNNIDSDPKLFISAHPSNRVKTPLWVKGTRDLSPTPETVEEQFAQFIEDNIDVCFDNFSVITDQVDIQSLSSPQATVSLNREDITVLLDYTLELQTTGQSARRDQYVYGIDIPLRSMLTAARTFTQQIHEQTFFADTTIDLLAAADPKVPMSGIEFTCDPPVWQENVVRDNIIELLYYNVPRMQVRGAETIGFEAPDRVYVQYAQVEPDDFLNGDPARGAPSDIYEYQHFYIHDGQDQFYEQNDITFAFAYQPEFGMDMTVRPNNGGKLEASSGQGEREYLRFFCMQVYHFTYDLIFNIQANMIQNAAFEDGSPFILRFGIPVQINHNLPDNSEFTLQQLTPTEFNSEFCNQRVDQVTNIFVQDLGTGQLIEGADVEYHCFRYACPLGKTAPEQNGRNMLRTSIPEGCSAGSLYITKNNYVPLNQPISEPQSTVELQMVPLREMNYKVVLGANTGIIPTQLNRNQRAFVSLDDQFSEYRTFNTFEFGQLPVIKLVSGTTQYNATVLVYDDEKLIGGFIGPIRVEFNDLRNDLTFYAYETRLQFDNEIDAYTFLRDDEVYKPFHEPRFS